jgi:hypothetical protein
MNNTNNHDERIAKMTFTSVYPHYLAKVEKKGKTKEELHQVLNGLLVMMTKAFKNILIKF